MPFSPFSPFWRAACVKYPAGYFSITGGKRALRMPFSLFSPFRHAAYEIPRMGLHTDYTVSHIITLTYSYTLSSIYMRIRLDYQAVIKKTQQD